MNKKQLISIANDISKVNGTEKYFNFASNYLMGLKEKTSSTKDFFHMLEVYSKKTNDPTIRRAFDVTGSNGNSIRTWIDSILKNNNLKNLSIADLTYVMSCASRFAKIYDMQHPKNSSYNNKSNHSDYSKYMNNTSSGFTNCIRIVSKNKK